MSVFIQTKLAAAIFLTAPSLCAQTEAKPDALPANSTEVYDIVEQVPIWSRRSGGNSSWKGATGA